MPDSEAKRALLHGATRIPNTTGGQSMVMPYEYRTRRQMIDPTPPSLQELTPPERLNWLLKRARGEKDA